MYSDRELIRFAMHKARLRRRIARQRTQCVEAASQLVRPFAWLDRVWEFGRKLGANPSTAVVPMGLLAVCGIFPRVKMLRPVVPWLPFLLRAARRVGAAITSRRSS